ncbi:hypothetical protein LTR96_011267 [Exophiala xenobiotica]|nr:hypothetical protein LTR72_012079 [Exophiala xenobiotica]KAK5263308.1 hypothetical protein LTR96_011267 [Exophiala xenobiotica]KAK5284850.1 hypothetical protein LTR14_011438 [Exophiala xenobiotica]KAK5332642.1 hypothetical protein LTR98_011228 [Exophiala xenobiotica]KAK5469002.1 hypothetical protein LTR55_011458 [Exophiala xenobiotica]
MQTDQAEQDLVGTPDTEVLDEPFSPKTSARLEGDFARLIPVNHSAKVAFNEIAQRLRLDPEWHLHARKFIHVDPTGKELTPFEDSEADDEVTSKGLPILSGHYRLNLTTLPKTPRLGWIWGSGRKDLPDGGVDLLLTSNGKRDGVLGRHGRLFHTDNGFLAVAVPEKKVVYINGQERLEGAQRVIGLPRTGLTMGNLAFRLEFTQLSAYRTQLNTLLSERHDGHVHPSLDPTPQFHHFELKGYMIQEPLNSGGHGVVLGGVNRETGKTVAVKRLQRTSKNLERIRLEIDISKRVKDHPNLCHLITDMYSGGEATWIGDGRTGDVYLVSSPLAWETFIEFTMSAKPHSIRQSAMQQALCGLAHLHSKGIMHRDLKPTNLMMVSYDPPHAIIIDYGSATFSATSDHHGVGTIAYLAPEVLAIKAGKSKVARYDRSVDVWAMGLTGYQLFFQEECTWKNGVGPGEWEAIKTKLRGRPGILSRLLESMLAWESDRPNAAELKDSEAWLSRN